MKKLILIGLLLVSVSVSAALVPILPQNFTTNAGPLQAGSGVTFVTNADKTITISSTGGGSGIATLNGFGTNTSFYSPNDGSFSSALNAFAYPDDINSQSIGMWSFGTTSAATAHSENLSDGLAADFGVWGSTFGPPYTGSFGIDLYNRPNPLTQPGPRFVISAAGKSTVVADSGVQDHPMFTANPTNGFVDLMRWKPDDRIGFSGFHFDPVHGVQGLIVGTSNLFNGQGTVTATASRTVTGSGTKFLTEVTLGSLVYQVSSGNGGLVTAIASDTSLTLANPVTIVAGSSYFIQLPAITTHDSGALSNFWITANGGIFSTAGGILGGVSPLTFKDGSQVYSLYHAGTSVLWRNETAGSVPFSWSDSSPDSSLAIAASGSLSIKGFSSSGASTNAGTLLVQSNLTVYTLLTLTNSAATNGSFLSYSNLNGSAFWLTTNGNLHASNALNSGSITLTNGGGWFGGGVTVSNLSTTAPTMILEAIANQNTNYLSLITSAGTVVGGFNSNASVRVNAGTSGSVSVGVMNSPTNGIFFASANSTDFANSGTNSLSVTNGNLVLRGALITAGAVPPTVAAGTGAGTSPSNVQVDATSNDTTGNFSLTTGTSPAASGTIVTITFAVAKDKAPRVFLTSSTASGGIAINRVYVTSTTSGFSIVDDGTALSSATGYGWNYLCIQ